LGERCDIHGAGLNFYSSKEQGFKCLSCLINKEDV
jgi:anaerobic ribonucleoside-triphosphate reductase